MRRRTIHTLLVAGFVLAFFAMPVLSAYLDSGVETSGTIPVGATNGPTVHVADHGGTMNLTGPESPDDTVILQTANGNATFTSQGHTNVTVTEINGTWTNLTNMDVATNELYVDPEDKSPVEVRGDTTDLNIREGMALDDGREDFIYAGPSGTTTVTVRQLPADTDIRAIDAATGEALGGNQSDANGQLVLDGMPNSEHTVELKESEGGPGLSNPTPEGPQTDFPTTLGVNVSDPDFDDGENVTVDFYLDGTYVGSNSTTQPGRVTTSIAQPSRGNHTVRAVAEDSTGNTKELTWDFSVPNELEIRRATENWELINDREVRLTFYEGDEIHHRNTTDGNVSLDGLPVDGNIVVSAEAESTSGAGVPNRAYYRGEVVIEDITDQQTIYLLDTNETVNNATFTLSDRTGRFEGNGAMLFIQQEVNRTGTAQWETYYADEFGVDGATATLRDEQRYRIIVKNDDGDTRVLGTYVSDAAERVPLTVGSVQAQPGGNQEGYGYNISYINSSADTQNYVQFGYNDTENETDSVTVRIYERHNESNVLMANTTFSGPLGTFKLSETVPADQENKTWVVEAYVDRGGETQQIRSFAGPRRGILGNMPPWLVATISVGALFVVAGLFSQLNGHVGGLVVSGMGGVFWFLDFLPQETGVGVVVLALVIAAVIFINETRGAPA